MHAMSNPIELFSLKAVVAAPLAGAWQVDPKDSAKSVMTDFTDTALITVLGSLQVDAGLEVMKHAGVRSAFVMSDDRASVLGFITAYDIMGEKPLRFLQTSGGSREDVLIRDIMERAEDWLVARLADVERANVQTMLDLFQKTGRTHLPVVEEEAGKGPRLRGVFSGAKLLRLTRHARVR
jgi:CBS domain-containing protein